MSARIPGGCSTYSKTLFAGQEGYPQQLVRGVGATVWDTQDRAYIDWWSGLGALSLGYQYPAVDKAIIDQLMDGIAFSLPHRLEGETAELLCDMTDTEQVRWCKNGSDATEAAVRLARKVTGRNHIITTGYHGFHSDLVCSTDGKDGGIVDALDLFLTRVETVEHLYRYLAEDVACILAEPIFADGTIWPWAEINDACHRAGALLIFDEVITGFRYRPGPVLAPYFYPDLYCFGKAIANGMPLACVAGPRELMQEYEKNIFFSSTASAECLSLAACKATLEVMRDEPVHECLWKIGQLLIDGARGLKLNTSGLAPRTQFRFPDDTQRDRFLSGMAKRGHLLGRDTFIQYSHLPSDVAELLGAAEEVLRELP